MASLSSSSSTVWELSPNVSVFKCYQVIDGSLLMKIMRQDDDSLGLDIPSFWKDPEEKQEKDDEEDRDANAKSKKVVTKKHKKNAPKYTSRLSRFLSCFIHLGGEWDKRIPTQWCRELTYKYAESHQNDHLGRFFSFPAGQQLPHALRDILFHRSTTVDIVNCHYTLLWNFLSHHEINLNQFPSIASYAESPDSWRSFFCRQFTGGIDSSDAKHFFIGLLYGAKLAAWETKNARFINDDRIKLIAAEVDKLRSLLREMPVLVASLAPQSDEESPWNYSNRQMQTLLENIEAQIMVQCVHRIQEKYGAKAVRLYLFDGIEVDTEFSEAIVNDLHSFVFEHFGYSVEFKIKPKSTNAALLARLNSIPDHSYESVKLEFEKTHLKVICPVAFWSLHRDSTGFTFWAATNESNFKCTWYHMQYFNDETGKMDNFISRWMGDCTLRVYEYAGYYPDPSKCPSDMFNLFTGFPVEVTPACLDWSEEQLDDAVSVFLEILRYISENEEHVQYILDFFAHLFRFPQTKPRVCLVFHSNYQGVGKQLFLESIVNCIGLRYYAETSNPENDLFGNFNGLLANKLLMVLDETRVTKMEHMERFKNLITSTHVPLTLKHRDTVNVVDFTRYVITTNKSHPVLLEDKERRFAITTTRNPELPGDFVSRYRDYLQRPEIIRCWYDYLRARPVPEDYAFGPHRPVSSLYNDIRMASIPVEIQFIVSFIQENMYETMASSSSFVPHNRERQEQQQQGGSVASAMRATQRLRIEIESNELYQKYSKFLEDGGYQFKGTHIQFSTNLNQFLSNSEAGTYSRQSVHTAEHRGRSVWCFVVSKMMQFFIDKKYINTN